MELLSKEEIQGIISEIGGKPVTSENWYYEEFTDKIIGYLGDHLNLIIDVNNDTKIKLFVKCMPRFDLWKAQYLRELNFFKKEYVMLNSLFREFQNCDGDLKWRPKLYYIREDLFVFEDVYQQGYKMPDCRDTLTIDELRATVKTLAIFHAQSYIYEEKMTKILQRPYRISEDYDEYLHEPTAGHSWRNTGRNAAIDFLKVFSKYRLKTNFATKVESVFIDLFNKAFELMKPSSEYRNVVIHRDLWSNNIFIKNENGKMHAMFVDYQTVLYASPMLDLSSLIYFNSMKPIRDQYTEELIELYYETLTDVLQKYDLNVNDFLPNDSTNKVYNHSLIFSTAQAALIVPIVAMKGDKKTEIFCNPEKSIKANIESRSEEFIEIATEDLLYRDRVTDVLDDIVERFIYPDC